MGKNIYKVGDKVIGLQYPDDVPAEVIELVKTTHECGFVVVEFLDKGHTRTATIAEYRIKHN